MADKDFTVTFEIEPIVKVDCAAFNCKNNLVYLNKSDTGYCNLKHVYIDNIGTCEMFEPMEQERTEAA